MIDNLDFDPDKVKEAEGLTRPLLSQNPKRDLSNEPTINIEGITAGYQEEGVKTVTPRFASAKLDFRLAPSQDPTKVPELVRQQLAKNGYEDIKVTYLVGQPGYRSDVTHPFVKLVAKNAADLYGQNGYQYVPNSFGAGPAYAFGRLLKLPVLGFGIGNANSRAHGANENIKLADAAKALTLVDRVLQQFK